MKVKKLFKDLEISMPVDCIDHVHRIRRVKTSNDGEKQQAVIVKFRSWEKRVTVYRARKNLDNINVLLYPMPKRAKLFSVARQRVKWHSGIQFAFVDINCDFSLLFIAVFAFFSSLILSKYMFTRERKSNFGFSISLARLHYFPVEEIKVLRCWLT